MAPSKSRNPGSYSRIRHVKAEANLFRLLAEKMLNFSETNHPVSISASQRPAC